MSVFIIFSKVSYTIWFLFLFMDISHKLGHFPDLWWFNS